MEKVDSQLRREIMSIIQKEIDDPDMELLSITRVRTTSDLSESRVYFSMLDESKYVKAQEVLDSMKGFIRGLLGKRIRLRILPELNFFPDKSIKYSVDIYQKIEEIKNEEQSFEKNNRKDK